MAEVVITTRVNNELVQKTVDTFSGLKKEIRAAKDELLSLEEGSEDFKRVQKNISELQTSIKGLGDTAKIQGTGVERLQQSFNLLNESFLTGDLDKAKIALAGVGQAMKAIPIFLLIEGFQLLIENFDKIIVFFKGATTEIDRLTEALNDQKDAVEDTVNYYNRIITLSKAAGENEITLNKLQIEAGEERLKKLKEEEKAIYDIIFAKEKSGEKTDEEQKQLRELDKEYSSTLTNTAALYLERDSIQEKAAEAERERRKKLLEDQKKRNKELLNETLKRLQEEEKLFYNKIGAERKAEQDAAAEREKERLAAEKAYLDKQAELDKQFADLAKDQRQKDLEDEIAKNKKAVDDKKKSEDAKKQAVTVGLNAAATLTAAFFAFQLNGAKGNAKEELRIRKQMFEVDKAFNVARAIQDGIRSVQAALTIPPPGGQILAGVNAGLAAANVAKILATKFDGGTSGGDASGGGISTGGGGAIPNTSASVPAAPQFNQTTLNGGTNDQTINNQQLTVRAYVVESEISQSQKIVERIKRTSKFG
jgi:hypothetical protein